MFSHWVEMIPKEKKIMDIYPSIFFKVPYHCLFRNQIKKERSNCLVKRYEGPILINPYLICLGLYWSLSRATFHGFTCTIHFEVAGREGFQI